MKALVAAVFVLSGFSLAVHAQVAAKETPELKALQSKYKADTKAALKPIRDRYIAQCEALLRSFTTKGDLAAANAVQEEITAIKKAGNDEAGGTAVSRRELASEAIGQWFWGSPKLWLSLRPDGKAYLDQLVLTWKVGSESTIVLLDPKRPALRATLEFDSKVESFTAKDFDGNRVSGTRREAGK